MQLAFSRFRVSMELASEKIYSLVAQVIWWALVVAVAGVVWFAFNSDASAHGRHHYRHHHHWHHARVHRETRGGETRHVSYSDSTVIGWRPSGCPHRWCGCGVSLKVFGKIIPELNLAANWRFFPAAIAAAGNVAWRWGHVFYIEAVNGDGTVLAYDPNSGHGALHVHNRSLRGFHVVNPHAARYASR